MLQRIWIFSKTFDAGILKTFCFGFLFFVFSFTACSSTSKSKVSAVGVPSDALKGSAAQAVLALDSTRIKFNLEIFEEKAPVQKLSAVLFSVPDLRYRLELSTNMGIGVASLLWTDSLWTIVFPTEKTYLQGNGYLIGTLDGTFPHIHIHRTAAWMEQKFLPEQYEVIAEKDSADVQITWAKDVAGMPFSFAKRHPDSLKQNAASSKQSLDVLWLQIGEERLYIDWPDLYVEKNGKPYLKITIKKTNENPSWNGAIWKLPVPYGYEKLQTN